jgi:beta-1,4-mannosyltransferase
MTAPVIDYLGETQLIQAVPAIPVITTRSSGAAQPRGETWKHRLHVSVLVLSVIGILYTAQMLIWPHNPEPHTVASWVWSWAGVLWAVAAVPALFEITGLYLWRAPRAEPQRIRQWVSWRVVSRGENVEALTATIAGIRREMKAMPLFRYEIEVIVDKNTAATGLPEEGGDLHYIRVPLDYTTPNHTFAKARALNYALETSPLRDDAWIVHLDEESQPTRSGIIGIAAAIREEDENRPRNPRIGQGTITYHRSWKEHPFFTLSDCIRSGSDRGRLYLSMKLGVPLFGLHGSFIVIRNDVEKAMGFDVGPRGSLTEDAWWGTMAMDRGYRCRWVEGHIAEQCTERARDFLKQRRRWFNGLARTSLSRQARLRWRAVIIISMLAWASAPLALIYTIAHIATGGYVPPEIRVLANFSLAVYIATTLVGLRLNLREHGIRKILPRLGWALTWLACLPVFSTLESAAVAYAIARPAKSFYVVRK